MGSLSSSSPIHDRLSLHHHHHPRHLSLPLHLQRIPAKSAPGSSHPISPYPLHRDLLPTESSDDLPQISLGTLEGIQGMSGTATSSSRCAACKYLRRKCEDCVLAPYFPSTHPDRFACVHKIFGASNVTRMLQQIPQQQRAQAADTISYEAYWRVRDPIYGCVGIISMLQQEIQNRERELAMTQALLAMHAAAEGSGPPSWGQFAAEPASAVATAASYQFQGVLRARHLPDHSHYALPAAAHDPRQTPPPLPPPSGT